MLTLLFGVQIAASVQKQQGSYRAVITVHPAARSNDNLTVVWCGTLPSESYSRSLLEDMKVDIYGAVIGQACQGANCQSLHLHLLGGSTAQRPESSQQTRRGFYRSSTGKWYIPEGVKSSGACQEDSRSGCMKSEIKATNGAYELSFDIPAQLAPLSLAFELQLAGSVELSKAGQRFAVPIGMSAGRTTRLGESCSLAPFLHSLSSAPLSRAATQQLLAMAIATCMRHVTDSERGVQRSKGAQLMFQWAPSTLSAPSQCPNVSALEEEAQCKTLHVPAHSPHPASEEAASFPRASLRSAL